MSNDKHEIRLKHWKTDVLGLLVMAMATVYVAHAEWGARWSLEHIRVGVVTFLILAVGFGIHRRWGFRDR